MTLRAVYSDKLYGEYRLSANKNLLDLDYLFQLLCIPSKYSTGLPLERFPTVLENATCFGVFKDDQQIGFARVISDKSEFASLWDLFIDEPHRGKGIAKALLRYIFDHPELRGIFRWFLMTEDAHDLYQKFGFKREIYNPYVMMKVNTAFG